jgi:hypothetical protein
LSHAVAVSELFLSLVLCFLIQSSQTKLNRKKERKKRKPFPFFFAAMRPQRTSIHAISTWVRRQPPKVKAFLAVVSGMAALVLLRFIVHDHDNLFVAAEAVHSLGISVLIYKLMKEKTCAG